MGLKDNPRFLGTTISQESQVVTVIEEQEKITIKELKQLELYKKTRGKYEGTWFTPLLAIDIVGWLDPEIRLHFNAIVYEKLFESRITISNKIRELTDKITDTFGKQNEHYFMMLNYHLNLKVYGNNHIDIRNESTKAEYDKMTKIIDRLVMLIDEELLDTPEAILSKIDKMSVN